MRLLLVVVAVAAVGCGSASSADAGPVVPDAGASCLGEDPVCSSATSAVFCEGGTWKAFDCPGGCSTTGVRCMPTTSSDYVACPTTYLGAGVCLDLQHTAMCNPDGWLVGTCSRCEIDAGRVLCN